MEAPEKIWINPSIDLPKLNGVIDKNSVQYVRKDAFIEKTCEWLKNNVEKYYYLDEAYDKVISTKNLNNDFKKYMEE
jgi:hypothetical protein